MIYFTGAVFSTIRNLAGSLIFQYAAHSRQIRMMYSLRISEWVTRSLHENAHTATIQHRHKIKFHCVTYLLVKLISDIKLFQSPLYMIYLRGIYLGIQLFKSKWKLRYSLLTHKRSIYEQHYKITCNVMMKLYLHQYDVPFKMFFTLM